MDRVTTYAKITLHLTNQDKYAGFDPVKVCHNIFPLVQQMMLEELFKKVALIDATGGYELQMALLNCALKHDFFTKKTLTLESLVRNAASFFGGDRVITIEDRIQAQIQKYEEANNRLIHSQSDKYSQG